MKERLTKRDKDGNAVAFNYIKTAGEFKEIVDRLAEYEDLEEQGLIVRLPCKVGDTVWYAKYYDLTKEEGQEKSLKILESWEVYKITIYDDFIFFGLTHKGTQDYNSAYITDFGDVWFTSKAEAEKKLKELKGEE